MEITDIRIRKVKSDNKMKAIVSVTFDDEIAIHDIKIIEGNETPFIAMPSRRMPNGDFRDIAHPINSQARKKMEDAIFAAYNEFLDNMRLTEGDSEGYETDPTTFGEDTSFEEPAANGEFTPDVDEDLDPSSEEISYEGEI